MYDIFVFHRVAYVFLQNYLRIIFPLSLHSHFIFELVQCDT